jgi:uncharacterized DUF497 family protein
MQFEWGEFKSQQNLVKHGVCFDEAKEVFEDPLHIARLDHRYSYFEERWITLGSTKKSHILVVANLFFSDEGEEIIRIISARMANNQERGQYENT